MNAEELEAIEIAIETRISEHETEHYGLYSACDLEILRPIWREQIIKDIGEIVGMMPDLGN